MKDNEIIERLKERLQDYLLSDKRYDNELSKLPSMEQLNYDIKIAEEKANNCVDYDLLAAVANYNKYKPIIDHYIGLKAIEAIRINTVLEILDEFGGNKYES